MKRISYSGLGAEGPISAQKWGFGIWAGTSELGLIGFVFCGWAGRDVGVTLCGIIGCIGFGVLGIGFVLRNEAMNARQDG